MHGQNQMVGLNQMNCGTQTESSEIVDIKELQFLYESLQKELAVSRETLHARCKHDMNAKLCELWVKIKTHLQGINRERQAAEQRLRLAAQTRVSDAAAKIMQEFRAKQNDMIANVQAAHLAEVEALRIQLARTNLEKLKAMEKAQKFEHVIWRQSQALQRHRVPENEINETENGEFIVERLQEELHEKEETIADLERKVFQFEQDLKRYEPIEDDAAFNEERIPVKPRSRPATGGSVGGNANNNGDTGETINRRRGAIIGRAETARSNTSARSLSHTPDFKADMPNRMNDGLGGEDAGDFVSAEDNAIDQEVIDAAVEQIQDEYEQKMQELREEQETERAKFKLEMNRMQRQYQKQLALARESAEKVQNAELIHTVLGRQEAILKFATVLFGKQQHAKAAVADGTKQQAAQPQQKTKRKTVQLSVPSE
jgi:hypothetical protein